MFVSLPHYASTFPAGLMGPGEKHWRLMEVALHSPWFVLTAQVPAEDGEEPMFSRTFCIAGDRDLLDVLRGLGDAAALSLVCMLPGWFSDEGRWTSREILKVWLCRRDAGEHAVLEDEEGRRFTGDLAAQQVDESVQLELLLSLDLKPEPRG